MSPQRVIILGDGFDLEVDVSLSETHTGEVDVTEHAVESGADVADHRRERPVSLQLRGVVAEEAPVAPDESGAPSLGSRPAEAWRRLLDLKASTEPVTVVTELEIYTDVTMTALTVTRDSASGRALYFDATFRRIHFAASKTRKALVIVEPRSRAPSADTTKRTATEIVRDFGPVGWLSATTSEWKQVTPNKSALTGLFDGDFRTAAKNRAQKYVGGVGF